jgi:hypothetical protein
MRSVMMRMPRLAPVTGATSLSGGERIADPGGYSPMMSWACTNHELAGILSQNV